MEQEVTKYLKSYSFDSKKVNRLIVSNFLYSNNLLNTKNKIIKDFIIDRNSDDYPVLEDFVESIQLHSIEELIKAFEFVISPKERVVTGAIYTPKAIRDYIIDQIFEDNLDAETARICDPACGCGGFLYTAALKIQGLTNKPFSEIIRDNLFGLDIQPYSIERSKILLSLASISLGEDYDAFDFNLYTGNALSFDWSEHVKEFAGFDSIVGNPPYVCSRNINIESRELLENWEVSSTGHPDLYIPFFELGLSNLRNGGILGYITMNTFFKSINGRALRKYLAQFDNTIVDFGGYQVFDSKSTYTCICLIRKQSSTKVRFAKSNSINALNEALLFEEIDIDNLDHFNGWNLQEIDYLNHIESVGAPLGDLYKTRNGIATLKNKIFIFSPIDEDEEYYYLQNGDKYAIEKNICSDIVNSNKFTKVKSIEDVLQKVIFPYRYVGDKIQILAEEEFSANYPQAYRYLRDKKEILATRDKGKGKYEKWYAYGRNQSLEKMKYKLFFPHISSNIPNFVPNDSENLLFYNGLALIGENEVDIQLMQKLLGSRLFWFYITNSSKPYGSGYFSLSRNYIKKFGIPDFTDEEIQFMINQDNQEVLNKFIDNKYGINTEMLGD